MEKNKFEERLKELKITFHHVVPFNSSIKLLRLDFTENNRELTDEILNDTGLFSDYVNRKLKETGAEYGIGGYGEHRTIYSRSQVFDTAHPDLPEGKAINTQALLIDDNSFEAVSSLEDPEGQYGYQWADAFYYKHLKEFALEHRNKPTKAEEILWEAVKAKKLGEYKFRRQHIIDKYITDIICLDKRLVVEIDGLIHQLPDNIESDKERTKSLESKGFKVIRFTNDQILNQLEDVLSRTLQILSKRPSVKESSNLSSPFGGQGAEPRRLHLGVDIWGKADTPIYVPLAGTIHSFAFNDAYGDYGATLILQHQIDDLIFHTLYGHLSLKSIQDKKEGQTIKAGEWIASFGEPQENGHWPPHLHFQVILNMQGLKGDYPGVCKFSEREKYLANCPDPDLILGMMQYAK
jgi:very-short-patch-repair endonuclease